MPDAIVDQVIAAIGRTRAHTVDITGGAPELHPRFRDLVEAAVAAGKHVMDRCNLTVLLPLRNRELVEWLAARAVEIVASLPHYRRPSTDAQRGRACSTARSRRCGCSTPPATGAATRRAA